MLNFQNIQIDVNLQNSVFQCNLDKNFRDIECKKSDVSMKWAGSFVFSPNLGMFNFEILLKIFVDIP